MELSTFVLRLVFLAMPGIAAKYVFEQLTGKRGTKDWREIITLFFFSMVAYGAYMMPLVLFNKQAFSYETFLGLVSDDKKIIPWTHVFGASGIGVVIAFLASHFYRFKLINRFGQFIRATNRYGDEDVWEYFHNDVNKSEWVVVIDHKLNLKYFCYIESFQIQKNLEN